MTRNDFLASNPPPDLILHRLIDSHGAWATLAALARVVMAGRRARSAAEPGSDHLRRDIGLPEKYSRPPPFVGPWF
jgi:hypothetical protein